MKKIEGKIMYNSLMENKLPKLLAQDSRTKYFVEYSLKTINEDYTTHGQQTRRFNTYQTVWQNFLVGMDLGYRARDYLESENIDIEDKANKEKISNLINKIIKDIPFINDKIESSGFVDELFKD